MDGTSVGMVLGVDWGGRSGSLGGGFLKLRVSGFKSL